MGDQAAARPLRAAEAKQTKFHRTHTTLHRSQRAALFQANSEVRCREDTETDGKMKAKPAGETTFQLVSRST
jgi:hypothetical protein